MLELLQSKAFWTAFIDCAFRLVNILGEKYWPDKVKMINDLWLALQPVVLLVLAYFATNEIVIPTLLTALP